MSAKGQVVYRERSSWNPLAAFLFWGAILGALAAGSVGGGPVDGWMEQLLYAGGVVGVAGLLWVYFAGLTVEVTPDGVRFGLGNAQLVRKFVPFDEIEELESVTYRPLREFGGWGVRGFGKRSAWTASGDKAVVLHLAGDRQIYVGSERPQRLEERIRTTMEQARRR